MARVSKDGGVMLAPINRSARVWVSKWQIA